MNDRNHVETMLSDDPERLREALRDATARADEAERALDMMRQKARKEVSDE